MTRAAREPHAQTREARCGSRAVSSSDPAGDDACSRPSRRRGDVRPRLRRGPGAGLWPLVVGVRAGLVSSDGPSFRCLVCRPRVFVQVLGRWTSRFLNASVRVDRSVRGRAAPTTITKTGTTNPNEGPRRRPNTCTKPEHEGVRPRCRAFSTHRTSAIRIETRTGDREGRPYGRYGRSGARTPAASHRPPSHYRCPAHRCATEAPRHQTRRTGCSSHRARRQARA